MPDFSLLQIPNFAQSALGGYQAGQALGQRQRVQDAMQGIDLKRPETIAPLLQADPEHGIALLGASTKMLEAEREMVGREATTKYLEARFAKPLAATPGSPSTASPGQTAIADAEHQLISADPDGYMKLRKSFDDMDEAQLKRVQEAQTALHDVALATRGLSYDQRRAYIASQASLLQSHYVTPEQIAGFDPTDQNLDILTNQALGVKGVAEREEKARADKLAADRAAEDARHNRVSEGQGEARIGVAQGALKVAQTRAAKAADSADNSDLNYLMGGN
jgi:hypothetical protein